jgi:Metallo-beta-lactamase superfamily
MDKISPLAIVLISVFGVRAQDKAPFWSADLNQIRQTTRTIPGARPLRVNVLKFAESRRTKNFSVKGMPTGPSVQARTVYQVVYPDGYIMIDSGMDPQVHKFFGRGVEEPYFPEAATQVERALRGAKSIVMTHEHGDHGAGVIRTPFFAELAPKTIVTRTQVQTLLTNPQMPEIRLTPEMAAHYIVIDYERYFPFAPGFVLIKAPGHTPGSQMIYLVPAIRTLDRVGVLHRVLPDSNEFRISALINHPRRIYRVGRHLTVVVPIDLPCTIKPSGDRGGLREPFIIRLCISIGGHRRRKNQIMQLPERRRKHLRQQSTGENDQFDCVRCYATHLSLLEQMETYPHLLDASVIPIARLRTIADTLDTERSHA